MKRRYLKDAMALYDEKIENRKARARTRTVSSLGHQQPLQLLESLIKKWPPHDLRYKDPLYDSTDEFLMKDLIKGVELKTLRKDLANNTLEFAVEFQSNLAEFERYNLVVREHNEQWNNQGRPETIFDPIHGEVYKVKDKFVDPASIESSFYPQPKSVYDTPTGPLSKARPSLKRVGYIRVVYQLSVGTINYTLGYVAYDSANRVIYYNEVTHRDLAYLVRRSVQELWGNPLERGKRGAFLEGIPLLIQGRKLAICKKDNTKPSILDNSATIKDSNPELLVATVQEKGFKVADILTRHWVPVGLICLMIWWNLRCITVAYGEHRECVGEYLIGMILIMTGLVVTRHLAQKAQRKASELDAAKRFM